MALGDKGTAVSKGVRLTVTVSLTSSQNNGTFVVPMKYLGGMGLNPIQT